MSPSKPTVLLLYELGSGLGHLGRLMTLGRHLAHTCRLVFAVPDLSIAASPLRAAFGQDVTLRQAPISPPIGGLELRAIPTHSLADVMPLFGFSDPIKVRENVRRWRSLVLEVQPDLIVADFAPSLRLAMGDSIPILVLGNGYTVPPHGRPMPPIRPWQEEAPIGSCRNEGRIKKIFDEVRAELDLSPLTYLADYFSGHQTFVSTITLLDPYAGYRSTQTLGPFNIPAIARGPTLSEERAGPDIFVYLTASHPRFASLLEALNAMKRPVRLYTADGDPRRIAAECADHIGIMTKPADFAAVLPQVRLVVHHAGLATAFAGLMAGTPQFVLPLSLEHLITARALIDARVALGYSANITPGAADLKRALTTMLDDPAWMERAGSKACSLGSHMATGGLEVVLTACRAFLQNRRRSDMLL